MDGHWPRFVPLTRFSCSDLEAAWHDWHAAATFAATLLQSYCALLCHSLTKAGAPFLFLAFLQTLQELSITWQITILKYELYFHHCGVLAENEILQQWHDRQGWFCSLSAQHCSLGDLWHSRESGFVTPYEPASSAERHTGTLANWQMPYRKVCRSLRWLSTYSSHTEHFCRTKNIKNANNKIYLATVSDNGDSLVQDESVFLWSLISREITNKPEKSLLTNEIIHSPRSDRIVSSELKFG